MKRRLQTAVLPLIVASASVGSFAGGLYAARGIARVAEAPPLGFTGSLTRNDQPMNGPHTLIFRFKKLGTTVCSSPSLDVTTDPSGAFQVQVPLSSCPSSLFDGPQVTVDILADGEVASSEQLVTHVPFAVHATQLGLSDCPAGYDLDPSVTNITVCKQGDDELVRVGTGATAFWIDRYEASVWTSKGGAGTEIDGSVVPYPATFPSNGQWTAPLYAASKRSVSPSIYTSWFQAIEACGASGKRLPTGDEWLRAARGTPDNVDCRIVTTEIRKTGTAGTCVSAWGAEDMIGNTTEWTNEWYAGLGDGSPFATWPGDAFKQDNIVNVTSSAYTGVGSDWANMTVGLPAAALRGGAAGQSGGSGAGIFAISLDRSPTNTEFNNGFRCVVPR